MVESEDSERRGPKRKYPDFAHTGPGTLAGRYMRMFWQPVYLSEDLPRGRAKPIFIMGERFTLFRGASGEAHVLEDRCAHRRAQLSTGWVEGDCIRCFYHGWKYDGAGKCVEQPAEDESFKEGVKVRAYPAREYLGLIFAFLGEGEPPPLPSLDAFAQDGLVAVQKRDIKCNYFNQVENSMDEVHINFVHRSSQYRDLGVSLEIPELRSSRTDYGLVRHAKRQSGTRTSHFLMPNILFSMVYYKLTGWTEHLAWRVPMDDDSHLGFIVDLVHITGDAKAAFLEKRAAAEAQLATLKPAHEVAAAVLRGELTVDELEDRPDLITIQDTVALASQGADLDRNEEYLGRSDEQVVQLRRMWTDDLHAIESGKPPRQWLCPADLKATTGVEEHA